MLRKIVLAMLGIGIANAIMAQTYKITGVLVDTKGESLAYTNCILLKKQDSTFAYGTTSDLDGVISLTGVVGGMYILKINAMGHESLWRTLDIQRDTNLGPIEINEKATLLNAVQITADRPLYSADGEKVLYNVIDDPSVQSGNATDALQNAPGVEVDAEGNIRYRGGGEVSIWINDKPSHLKAEGLKQYLKSLPAGTLQRIEVIAHPSAKYHTKNCVINIVTTAKVMRNELLCLGLNVNSKPQVEPWVDYVWANEKVKFNLFVSGDYDRYRGTTSSNYNLLTADSILSSAISTKGNSKNRMAGGNFGVDIDYYPDTSSTVNFWLWTTAAHDSVTNICRTERTEYIYNTGRYIYQETQGNGKLQMDAAFGVMYEKKLDAIGGMLFLDYTGTIARTSNHRETQRTHDSLVSLNFNRHNNSINPTHWHGITADVALPYNKHGEIDFGAIATIELDRQEVTEKCGEEIDQLRTFSDKNTTYEMSAYIGAEHHFGQFTLGLSLSMDNSWYRLKYSTVDSCNVSKHYLTLNPTVHASYSTASMHNFTLSYTHHATPPNARQLTIFRIYGYDNYSTGNPSLHTGYADKLELGWEHYFNKIGSVGITTWFNSIHNQTGALTDVAFCDVFDRVVAFSQTANIGTMRNGGISLNTTLRPIDFMNIRFYATLYDDYYKIQYRPGLWYRNEMLCYSLRLNVWAKFWDKLQIFVNAVYRSRTHSPLATIDPYFTLDLGISSDLLKRRLSLYLNVNDIFATACTGGESVNPYNPGSKESKITSRYVSFGLTWRFGRTEMEGEQRHGKKSRSKKGSEE